VTARKTTVNIDDMLAKEFGTEEVAVPTKTVTLFREDFTIRCDVNAFNIMNVMSGDEEEQAAAIAKTMVNIVDGPDRPRFKRVLGSQPNLTADKLLKVFAALVEAAGDAHPTDSSPGSKRSTQRKAVTRASVAR
jgi:hypothetical protein